MSDSINGLGYSPDPYFTMSHENAVAAGVDMCASSTEITVAPMTESMVWLPIASIAVTPVTPTITDTTQQFTATATCPDGTTRDVTNLVTWYSSTPAYMTINQAGLATMVAAGTSTITASFGGVSGKVLTSTLKEGSTVATKS